MAGQWEMPQVLVVHADDGVPSARLPPDAVEIRDGRLLTSSLWHSGQ